MNSIKLDLLLHDLDLEIQLVERLGHRPELSDGVMDKSPAFAAVVKLQTSVRLVVAKVGGSSKSVRGKHRFINLCVLCNEEYCTMCEVYM